MPSLPSRPSLEQLRRQARDLLRDARAGHEAALTRFGALPGSDTTPIRLSRAQLAIAREYGFPSWPALAAHVAALTDPRRLRPLIRPVELAPGRAFMLLDGTELPAGDVFEMFVAARDGDEPRVKALVARTAALATVEYNYTPPIHFAVREGHRGIVEFLADRGADLGYRSYPFQESLLTFADDRGHADVAEFLSHRLSRRFAVAPGTDAILAAAASGDAAAVDTELAKHPALARASNDTGDTALHQAARHGHVAIVNALVAAGADVDAIRADGYRPCHCAIFADWRVDMAARRTIVDALIAHGARLTVFIAAWRGDAAFVRDAVTGDRALANFADTCHHRVLSAAVRNGDVALIRFLLDHGADPNLPEEGAPHGQALWAAVHQRDREIVDLLLAHGADPNARVESSGTPMMRADGDPELTARLRAHGGRPLDGDRDRLGRCLDAGSIADAEGLLRAHPEWIADERMYWHEGIMAGPASAGRHDVLAMLFRLGARVPPVSKWAPNYYFKHEATAAFLLDHRMDPNHMNWHRFTLLHHMAARGEIGKARLLLDHGADIDAVDDEYGSTPLGVAARWGRDAMVDLLIDCGADLTAAAGPWAMPLTWAERKGHADIVTRLKGAIEAD